MDKAVRFEYPDVIPMRFGVSGACWQQYDQAALQDLMEAHTLLFPDFERSTEPITPSFAPWRIAGQPFTDSWGCVWDTSMDGITGTVVDRPLNDWEHFKNYRPPSPENQAGWDSVDWDEVAQQLDEAESAGRTRAGGLRHGHTFMTLMYLRGYENLIFDMADEEPRLWDLIEMVEAFNAGLVKRFINLGIEWMHYPEDLGMQQGPMVSPEYFRKFIKPIYQRLIQPAKDAGCIIHMHSDGDIRELIPDLLECGVEALNLQDLVNGIDWIAANLKGRIAIDLDVDRQEITRFGTPQQIDDLIREEVQTLGSRQGGLMLTHGLYPGPSLENIEALMDAMEKYAVVFS